MISSNQQINQIPLTIAHHLRDSQAFQVKNDKQAFTVLINKIQERYQKQQNIKYIKNIFQSLQFMANLRLKLSNSEWSDVSEQIRNKIKGIEIKKKIDQYLYHLTMWRLLAAFQSYNKKFSRQVYKRRLNFVVRKYDEIIRRSQDQIINSYID